jgi:hypothetical protein
VLYASGSSARASAGACVGAQALEHRDNAAPQRVAPLAEHGKRSTASPSALGSATRAQAERRGEDDRELRLMICALSSQPVDTAKSHEQASSSGKTERKPPQSFCDACWRLAQLIFSCAAPQPAGRSSRSRGKEHSSPKLDPETPSTCPQKTVFTKRKESISPSTHF